MRRQSQPCPGRDHTLTVTAGLVSLVRFHVCSPMCCRAALLAGWNKAWPQMRVWVCRGPAGCPAASPPGWTLPQAGAALGVWDPGARLGGTEPTQDTAFVTDQVLFAHSSFPAEPQAAYATWSGGVGGRGDAQVQSTPLPPPSDLRPEGSLMHQTQILGVGCLPVWNPLAAACCGLSVGCALGGGLRTTLPGGGEAALDRAPGPG